ncbi:hypothetical protein Q9966_006340 [Columba livia]|nr:hypothetical protein Q9966_006340 [Columba livia]
MCPCTVQHQPCNMSTLSLVMTMGIDDDTCLKILRLCLPSGAELRVLEPWCESRGLSSSSSAPLRGCRTAPPERTVEMGCSCFVFTTRAPPEECLETSTLQLMEELPQPHGAFFCGVLQWDHPKMHFYAEDKVCAKGDDSVFLYKPLGSSCHHDCPAD